MALSSLRGVACRLTRPQTAPPHSRGLGCPEEAPAKSPRTRVLSAPPGDDTCTLRIPWRPSRHLGSTDPAGAPRAPTLAWPREATKPWCWRSGDPGSRTGPSGRGQISLPPPLSAGKRGSWPPGLHPRVLVAPSYACHGHAPSPAPGERPHGGPTCPLPRRVADAPAYGQSCARGLLGAPRRPGLRFDPDARGGAGDGGWQAWLDVLRWNPGSPSEKGRQAPEAVGAPLRPTAE